MLMLAVASTGGESMSALPALGQLSRGGWDSVVHSSYLVKN